MPSSAAVSETPSTNHLLSALAAVAHSGLTSFVWADNNRRITSIYGHNDAGLQPGTELEMALPVLFGLEADLDALTPTSPPLHIPDVSIIDADGNPSRRLNLSILRPAASDGYIVQLTAIMSATAHENELDHEIRRRQLMEKDLAAKTLEYERINQQLAEFTYIISHDLKMPLRAIRYLTEDTRVELDKAKRVSQNIAVPLEAATKATTAILTQTRRMSNMLLGLLEYSRVGRNQDVVEPVEPRALIREIFTSLKPATSLTLQLKGTWPVLETVRAPLDLVLRNLIDNAVKYHDRPDGTVTVAARVDRQKPNHLLIEISDDGPGIAAEWHEAIFEPFRKIDDQHHADSSGLGLALVKKSTMSLGGTISVQSHPATARGTTFSVHWPLKVSEKVN
jgi:signal transduction histidine kinase